MASIETQQGKRRPRQPRPGDGTAVLTAPHREAATGRFLPENDFSRLRRLKAAYEHGFVGINPAEVVPHLRPFVELANGDASRMIEEAGAEHSPTLTGLAEQAANALAFARGLQALAATGDKEAQDQARHWMREYRQFVIALRAESRTPLRSAADKPIDVDAVNAQAEKELEAKRVDERKARAADEPSEPPSTVEPPLEEVES